ncbi:hypothetical protein AVEN_1527-1, partial [Araneus ventricosus]
MTPELVPPLQAFAPHQQREDVWPTTADLICIRYPADLQWIRVSNLELSGPRAETLPLGHRVPGFLLGQPLTFSLLSNKMILSVLERGCRFHSSQKAKHICPHRRKGQIVIGSDEQSASSVKTTVREETIKQRRQWGKQEISSTTDQLNAQALLADSENLATSVSVANKGNRNGLSVSNGTWTKKQISKTQPIRHPDNLKQEGTAEFVTTHQVDFNEKSVESHVTDSVITSSEMVQAESWNRRQIPKTQKIKRADNLKLSGSMELETTQQTMFNESAFQSKMQQSEQSETFKRPRTSLKLGGEFQSDSSYHEAFTPKQGDVPYKVKKGTSVSHLKSEGEMIFETTSKDYNAVSTHISRTSENAEDVTVLKPKKARPESEIKIPAVPISDETTLVSDYKMWKVERPVIHKPKDTLDLTDPEGVDLNRTFIKESSRTETSQMETSISDYKNWQVTRPVIHKPQDNLKSEGSAEFATTTDTDYSSRRDVTSKRVSNLESLTERTETESIAPSTHEEQTTVMPAKSEAHTTPADHGQTSEVTVTESLSENNKVSSAIETSTQAVEQTTRSDAYVEHTENVAETSTQIEQRTHEETSEIASQSEDQAQYLTWDQIRPKPIRQHSSLRQEGGMEFDTTNRSEFVSRSVERVKGVRPKTNTKLFEGDFDSKTMNQVMFPATQGEKVTPFRPKSNLHLEDGTFADETTAKREFQHWEIQKPPPIVPQSTLRLNSGVFEAETTNKSQFQDWGIERPKPIKPVGNLTQEGSMDFTTMNKLQFEEKQIERVQQFRPQTTTKLTGEFDGTTTNQVMFTAQTSERPHAVKPKGNLELKKGTFASETTNNSEFKQWQLSKPDVVTPRDNLHQEGSVDYTTVNRTEYAAKNIDSISDIRANIVKPKGNLRQEGSVDYTTMNQAEFLAKNIDSVSDIRANI